MNLSDEQVDSLTEWPGNPRTGDVGAICEAITANGYIVPVIVQKSSRRVFDGNHRLKAARALGMKTIPVVWADVDDDTALRHLLAANRLNDLAGYEEPQLAALLSDLAANSAKGLAGTGFDGDALDELLADLAALSNPATDPGPVEPPADPVTRSGDLWVLGEHRLLCGDSTMADAFETLLDEGPRAALLVTDPPYGVAYANKNEYLNAIGRPNSVEVPIEGDHQTAEEMSALWRSVFHSVRTVMGPGACYYVTGPQGGDLLLLLLLALRESGFPLRHMLIWAKNQFVIGRSDYNYQHEPIIYGWVDGGPHHFYGEPGESSLWQIDKPHESKLHPTMKPVALFHRAISNSTRAGQNVLDPFAGSGTALIACEQAGRKARLIEIDPGYCDVICKRFQGLTGILPSRDGREHDFLDG